MQLDVFREQVFKYKEYLQSVFGGESWLRVSIVPVTLLVLEASPELSFDGSNVCSR